MKSSELDDIQLWLYRFGTLVVFLMVFVASPLIYQNILVLNVDSHRTSRYSILVAVQTQGYIDNLGLHLANIRIESFLGQSIPLLQELLRIACIKTRRFNMSACFVLSSLYPEN